MSLPRCCSFMLCALVVVLCGPAVLGASHPSDTVLSVVPAVTGVVLPQQALGADGASVIGTYPSMHAVRVPLVARDRAADRLRSAGFDVQELAHVIHAPGRLIDPRREPPMDASFDAGLYLLQYAAPATPEWQAYLRLVDARVVQSLAERAVVVTARRSTAAALARLAWVEYVGPYVSAFKFAPAYGTAEGAYTLVMADTSLSAAAIAATRARVNGFVTETSHDGVLVARVQTDFLTAISLVDEPFVLGVEPYIAPQLSDERQDLGITGVSSPVGGNYLNWLAARGITPNALTQSGAIVDVADTGVDLGCYPYIGPQHDDLQGRLVYHNGEYGSGLDPQYKDNRGHGTIIAGIVGGLPTAGIDSAGSPTMGFGLTDAGNFYYGLGVAPGVRMGNTEIVNGPPVGTVVSWTTRAVSQRCNTPAAPCTYDSTTCAATVQTHSHNEYDATGTQAGVYSTDASLFDASVRDADHDGSLTLPLAITISAGNYRQVTTDNTTMVLAPATAKNIISMGAAESNRPTTGLSSYTCDTDLGGGDNPILRNTAEGYNVVAYCSRRGTIDGRVKPDLLAPATLILGPRTTSTANKYCAQAGNALLDFAPQYHGASGTSFAAPVAAGSIALLRYYYQTNYGLVPSPALYKAMLIAGSRSLTGATDRLGTTLTPAVPTVQQWPNAQQGWGMINLTDLLALTPQKDWVDQQVVLTQGSMYERTVYVTDPNKPVRVVVAWTDKEGAPNASVAQVNDLNVKIYWPDGYFALGNSFDANGWSPIMGTCGRPTCPATSDYRNNVEVLNINPTRFAGGANRTFTVRIVANTLNGIAVAGQSGGANNQDFALFVLNGDLQ